MAIKLFGFEPTPNEKKILYLTSGLRALMQPRRFDWVQTYCMFIGYPRSGHSLLGALLNAHPQMAIAHELDALDYLDSGFGRRQIFNLICANTEQFTREGAQWSGYAYAVPGQWQGRTRNPKVICDKKGGRSTLRLHSKPQLLDQLRREIACPLRLIHLVRNPYDIVATMMAKKQDGDTWQSNIDHFRILCQSNARIRDSAAAGELFEAQLEELIERPREVLTRLCEFLEVAPSPEYIEACVSLVLPSPRKARERAPWTPQAQEEVAELIATHDFLRGYVM